MVDEQNERDDKPGLEKLLQKVQPGMPLPEQERVKEQLQQAVNYLIAHHFEKLVQLLYMLDVDEKRLKALLKQKPEEDAARIIAELLLERQLQKAALRQRFGGGGPINNDESW